MIVKRPLVKNRHWTLFCSLLLLDWGQRQISVSTAVVSEPAAWLSCKKCRGREHLVSWVLMLSWVCVLCPSHSESEVLFHEHGFVSVFWNVLWLLTWASEMWDSREFLNWVSIRLRKQFFWKLALNSPLKNLWAQIFSFLSTCVSH